MLSLSYAIEHGWTLHDYHFSTEFAQVRRFAGGRYELALCRKDA